MLTQAPDEQSPFPRLEIDKASRLISPKLFLKFVSQFVKGRPLFGVCFPAGPHDGVNIRRTFIGRLHAVTLIHTFSHLTHRLSRIKVISSKNLHHKLSKRPKNTVWASKSKLTIFG